MYWELKENDFYNYYDELEVNGAIWDAVKESYDRGYTDALRKSEENAVVNFDETYNNAYNEGFENAIRIVNDFRWAIGLINLPELFAKPLEECWNEAEWTERLWIYRFKVGDEIAFPDGEKYVIYRVDPDYYGYKRIFYFNDRRHGDLTIQDGNVNPARTGRSFSEMPIMLEKMKGVE